MPLNCQFLTGQTGRVWHNLTSVSYRTPRTQTPWQFHSHWWSVISVMGKCLSQAFYPSSLTTRFPPSLTDFLNWGLVTRWAWLLTCEHGPSAQTRDHAHGIGKAWWAQLAIRFKRERKRKKNFVWDKETWAEGRITGKFLVWEMGLYPFVWFIE